MKKQYFDVLQPQFVAVKDAADEILRINQGAMHIEADDAERTGQWTNSVVSAVAQLALFVGALLVDHPDATAAAAAVALDGGGQSARRNVILPPERLVTSRDEIGQLATQFNLMAEHLQEYRKSSLGELLLAQRASQATIDSIPDPVIVLNADGEHSQCQRAKPMSLWRTDGLGTGRVKTMRHPPPRGSLDARRQRPTCSRERPLFPSGFEDAFDVPSPAGHRWFLLRATPVYEDEGKITGSTAILQDVTKLRRLDELKNNLVATVAHEFRTPLTSLRMAVHLCLDGVAGPLNEKQSELLYAAREECERLQATVDELLDLARIQAGRMEIEMQPVQRR